MQKFLPEVDKNTSKRPLKGSKQTKEQYHHSSLRANNEFIRFIYKSSRWRVTGRSIGDHTTATLEGLHPARMMAFPTAT